MRVWSLEFGGLRIEIEGEGSGFRVWGLGCRVQGLCLCRSTSLMRNPSVGLSSGPYGGPGGVGAFSI
jgi:hypothetical protein